MFTPVPTPCNAAGKPRLIGVELELGGLSEAECARICADNLGGQARQIDEAICQVETTRMSTLKDYLDTARCATPTNPSCATRRLRWAAIPEQNRCASTRSTHGR